MNIKMQVDYYSSGRIGDCECSYCKALMLRNEYKSSIAKKWNGRKTKCCSNGEVHTKEMIDQFDELQNPPNQLIDLINNPDQKENFLENIKPVNTSYAFASISGAQPDANTNNLCKYNGDFSFCFSDLYAPNGFLYFKMNS